MKSYEDLEIYQEAFDLAVEIRLKSIDLKAFDKFEVGTQIRRSSQSIKDNIVEGYGRRKYKAEFIRFLIISHASLLEAKSQAQFLNALYPDQDWNHIANKLDFLGIKIYSFLKYVEKNWRSK